MCFIELTQQTRKVKVLGIIQQGVFVKYYATGGKTKSEKLVFIKVNVKVAGFLMMVPFKRASLDREVSISYGSRANQKQKKQKLKLPADTKTGQKQYVPGHSIQVPKKKKQDWE